MSIAEDLVVCGQFTADGNPKDLDLGFVPTSFELWNETAFDSTANPGVTKRAMWFQGMANNEAFTVRNTNGAATDQSDFITTNGFVPRTGVEEQLGSVLSTGGAISQANPAVVTLTAHGLSTGDRVRLYGTTGMLQVASMEFDITRTGANTFTIPIDTSGFAAAATACSARQIIVPRAFTPPRIFVTGITAANPAVITTSTNHGLAAGEKYRLRVSSDFGMVEADGLEFEIASVTTTTITTDIDASGFTAFAFPTSATAAAGITFAEIVPVGDAATVLSGATDNTAFAGIRLGTSVCGAASDVIYYRAMRSVYQS